MAVAGPGQLNLDESPSWGSRSVDCFEKLEQIGEGTYGYARLKIFPQFLNPARPHAAYASAQFVCAAALTRHSELFLGKSSWRRRRRRRKSWR
jgi:hypothetical protein